MVDQKQKKSQQAPVRTIRVHTHVWETWRHEAAKLGISIADLIHKRMGSPK